MTVSNKEYARGNNNPIILKETICKAKSALTIAGGCLVGVGERLAGHDRLSADGAVLVGRHIFACPLEELDLEMREDIMSKNINLNGHYQPREICGKL